ncbi:helix-turn-helix transcriptional regulator [Cellulosimicrobium arenosum]|uniref:Helix-turn-helix transcriptional regulator n=2 Tax=Cellulosimicrobium arenosum TaxID=2708133 RepID=A0A927PDZ5_9MICO|nr:DUF5937 family protein [Cellulosimicrobium arenosum]MBD8079878.1 helix-turn-helix transcriptional regulator [Cellulosimicrobium arenosum]
MVELRLAPDDLSAIRFGLSPGHELAHAVRVLVRPQHHPLQWGWLRSTRPRVPREAFDLLRLVVGEVGYLPDFLTSTPDWDLTPDEELERLRRADVGPMRVDLGKRVLRTTGHEQRALRAMAADPARTRTRVADAWETFWEAALAPHWSQVDRLLRADIAARSRRVATHGVGAMVATLNEAVTWGSDAVRVRTERHEEVLDCAGSGLVLVPSVMSAGCAVLTERPAQPTLFYPALGVRETWTTDGRDLPAALAAVLGDGRARVLLALREPMSTSEVAAGTGLAISTASHHLAVLRVARLVDARREANRVMHTLTPLGEALTTR